MSDGGLWQRTSDEDPYPVDARLAGAGGTRRLRNESSQGAATAGKVTPQMRSGSNELRTYQLLDWIAPDDRTLIVNSVDRSLYRRDSNASARACAG